MSEPSRLFRCGNDGCRLTKVAEGRRRPWPAVRFYSCRFCPGPELFAAIGDVVAEERFVGLFAHDVKTGGFILVTPGPSPKETAVALALLSEVKIPLARLRPILQAGADPT